MAGLIINDLGINARQTLENVQTRAFCSSHQIFSYAHMPASACDRARIFRHSLLGSFPGLTGFTTDLFASIANPFAMIRLGGANTPDFRGSLTDDFAVITVHLNLTRLLIHFKRDS